MNADCDPNKAVLGICDIPQIRTSGKWIRIRLLSSVTLKMQKNIFFLIFSYNLPVTTLSSVLKIKFFAKFCVKSLFCKHYFSPLNIFMKKGERSGSGSIPLTNGSGSGRSNPDPEPQLCLRQLAYFEANILVIGTQYGIKCRGFHKSKRSLPYHRGSLIAGGESKYRIHVPIFA
jgi:hypothetical protein